MSHANMEKKTKTCIQSTHNLNFSNLDEIIFCDKKKILVFVVKHLRVNAILVYIVKRK